MLPDQVSLSLVLATVGRTSLLAMLESIRREALPCDAVLVVFDGVDQDGVFVQVVEDAQRRPWHCRFHVHMLDAPLKGWGQLIRGQFLPTLPPRTAATFPDDDDVYTVGAFATFRREFAAAPTKCHHFATQRWGDNISNFGPQPCGGVGMVIGGPTGVAPFATAVQCASGWGPEWGQDGDFWRLCDGVSGSVVHPDICYDIRPHADSATRRAMRLRDYGDEEGHPHPCSSDGPERHVVWHVVRHVVRHVVNLKKKRRKKKKLRKK
jgi:hypothetical protein